MFVKNPEYFLAIVKERSISKAADRLYLSQPYLSQYLAKLESNLGVTLLDRSHTPLRLTPAGELFYAYLERQDYLDRQLESDLRTLQSQKPQQLHIGPAGERSEDPAVPKAPAAPHRCVHLEGVHSFAGHPAPVRPVLSGGAGGPP